MRKLGQVACLALAIAMMAPPLAQGASPAAGLWSGTETKYWTGSRWQPYSQNVPFSFRVEGGTVLSFRTTSAYVWPGCTGGKTVTAKLPTTRGARVLDGQFRGVAGKAVGKGSQQSGPVVRVGHHRCPSTPRSRAAIVSRG